MTDIKTTHSEYAKRQARWKLISDCLGGEEQIKSEGEVYLPYPVAVDKEIRKTDDFKDNYRIYLEGAHFTNFTEQAVGDLTSGCFRRDVHIDPPLEDVDLDHILVDDITKETVKAVASYGRAFLLADYPVTGGEVSKQDEIDNSIGAYITLYEALDVINWTTKRIGREAVLTRVVLREVEFDDDGKEIEVYRELLLLSGIYTVRVHRFKDGSQGVVTDADVVPKINNAPLKRIPGTFVGSVSNNAKVDPSPVEGIARSNVKHYQTMGELFHAQTYTGHPQLVVTGAPEGFNKAAEKTKFKVQVGAASALVLEGEGVDAKILEMNGESLVHFKTLEQLEKSMSEQGARIKSLNQTGGVESAAALRIKHGGDSSQLADVATNVERAMEFVLNWAAAFMGYDKAEMNVDINKEFFDHAPDVNLLRELGVNPKIPSFVLYDYMKQVGLMDDAVTDADIESALDEDDIGGDVSGFNQELPKDENTTDGKDVNAKEQN